MLMKNNLFNRYHKLHELNVVNYPNYEKIGRTLTDEEIKIFLFDNNYFKYLSETYSQRIRREGYTKKNIFNVSNEEKIRIFDKYEKDIIPDSEEFIHRKDWMPLSTFQEVNDKWFDYPIFEMANDFICNNFVQKSKCLCIISCSKSKPYSENKVFKWYSKFCDTVVISEPGIIPISESNDFSYCYPFRYYNYNFVEQHKFEGLYEKKIKFVTKQTSNFIKKFNYEKIIFVAQPPRLVKDFYEIYNNLANEFKNNKFDYIITDELFDEIYRTKFPNSSPGMPLLFCKGSVITKNKFLESLNNLGYGITKRSENLDDW